MAHTHRETNTKQTTFPIPNSQKITFNKWQSSFYTLFACFHSYLCQQKKPHKVKYLTNFQYYDKIKKWYF